MTAFTIYNPITKRIAEERFFEHYADAIQYCKENYSADYIAKHEPFNSDSEFRKMLMDGTHPRIKTNGWGDKAAIISEDGKTILHCGEITTQDWVSMRFDGIKCAQLTKLKFTPITKVEFINLHNSLIREKEIKSAESFFF